MTEPQIYREPAKLPLPARALVVIAHPDDIESLCGGTVILLADAGVDVTYLLLTSGDRGSPDPAVDTLALAARREAEQRAAAAQIGVTDIVFLRYHDGEVQDDVATREQIAAQIRRVRPDLLITFDPWHSYTFHNDHRQAGLVAMGAARATARQVGPACDATGAVIAAAVPGHAVADAWLFLTARPDFVVNIEAVIARKIAMRLAHESQTADPAGMARGQHERAAKIGEPFGVALAEAFHRVQFPSDESFQARLAAGE